MNTGYYLIMTRKFIWLLPLLLPQDSDAQGSDEDGLLMDKLPIVLSATRLPQSLLNSPVSTTVIDREMILVSGFTHVADLFRLVPGFQVGMASGSHYSVAYHGQEMAFPTRTEVLVDGRSVYDNLLSSVKWNSIGVEIEDIEQIEVIRGPNAPVFGSNALVATINIKTRAPFEEQGTWINAVTGSQDTRRVQLRHADAQEALDYSVSLGYREDTGFSGSSFRPETIDSSSLHNLTLRGEYTRSDEETVGFQIGYEAGDLGTALPAPNALLNDHEGSSKSHFQLLRWNRATESRELSLQVSNHYLKQQDRYEVGLASEVFGVPPEVVLLVGKFEDQELDFSYADGTSERLDLEFQSLEKDLSWGQFVWGGGFRQDKLTTPHIYPHAQQKNLSARIFTNAEWESGDSFAVNIGAMLEHNELVAFFGSTRIAFNYHLSPHSNLRMSASHTQRSPSMLDEFFNVASRADNGEVVSQIQLSHGGIEEEELNAVEVGYTTVLGNGKTVFDIKLFHEHGDNLISGPTDESVPEILVKDGAEIIGNDDSYTISGIEGQVKYRPVPGGALSWQFSLAESERNRVVTLPDTKIRNNDEVTPKVTSSLLYSQEFSRGWSGSFGYYYMSDNEWQGDGGSQNSYDRLDVRLAKSMRFPGAEALFEMVAQNIGDSYYEYSSDNNEFETRYFIKGTLKF